MSDLSYLFQHHFLPHNLRIQSGDTIRQYRFAIDAFATLLGKIPTIEDLNDDNLLRLLRYFRESRGVAAITANNQVGRLKSLWTWLAKRGMIRTFPTVGRLPEPETCPAAWSESQLRALYQSAGEQPGQIAGIDAGAWWQALLIWLWNSGERYGATMALEWSMIDIDNLWVTIPPAARKGRRKTGIYRLWPDTLERLLSIRTPCVKVFPWDRCEGMYYHDWSAILKRAGLPVGRNRKTQSMRVSHASWLAVSGQDATRSLMHSNPATTRKYYIDAKIVRPEPPNLFTIG